MPPPASWALEFDSRILRLVRVTRSGSRYTLDACYEQAWSGHWEHPGALREAAGALMQQPGLTLAHNEPLVLCIADQVTMYRTLNLPPAPGDAMGQMIDAQLEALPAASTRMFVWKWQPHAILPGAKTQPVQLCGVRQQIVDSALEAAGALGMKTAGFLPAAAALAVAHPHLFHQQDPTVVLIDVAAHSASLTLMHQGRPATCAVLDESAEHWIQHLAQEQETDAQTIRRRLADHAATDQDNLALGRLLTDWSGRVREVYEESVAQLPHKDRPKRCLVVGSGRDIPGLAQRLGAALGLELDIHPHLKNGWHDPAKILDAAAAIGAALTALEPTASSINFLEDRSARRTTSSRRIVLRRVALVGWLVITVAALYGADWRNSSKLIAMRSQIALRSGHSANVQRRLGIAQYLRRKGTPPLAMLDEVSGVTPQQITVTELNYTSLPKGGGRLRLQGTAPAGALNNYLKALAQARSFKHVTLGHQEKSGKKKIKFDIVAAVSYWLGPTRPSKTDDKQEADDGAK